VIWSCVSIPTEEEHGYRGSFVSGRYLVFVVMILSGAGPAHATDVEYAVRWTPSLAAPTAVDVLPLLPHSIDFTVHRFEVRYLSLGLATHYPAGFDVIGRERSSDKGVESTFKIRGPDSKAAARALEDLHCPLVGPQEQIKLEWDVVWAPDKDGAVLPQRYLSWSCTVDGPAAKTFPAPLHAVAMPCTSTFLRRNVGRGWKLEEWTTPKGAVIEVSYSVTEGAETQAEFQKIVDRLLTLNAVPLAMSKTLLSSDCKK